MVFWWLIISLSVVQTVCSLWHKKKQGVWVSLILVMPAAFCAAFSIMSLRDHVFPSQDIIQIMSFMTGISMGTQLLLVMIFKVVSIREETQADTQPPQASCPETPKEVPEIDWSEAQIMRYNQALCLLKKSQAEQAMEVLEREDTAPEAYQCLYAEALLQCGRQDAALRWLEEITGKYPAYTALRKKYFCELAATGNAEKLVAQFRHWNEPSQDEHYIALADRFFTKCWRSGQRQHAARWMGYLETQQGLVAYHKLWEARTLIDREKLRQAETRLHDALMHHEDLSESYIELARLRIRQSRGDDARQAFRRAVLLNPEHLQDLKHDYLFERLFEDLQFKDFIDRKLSEAKHVFTT